VDFERERVNERYKNMIFPSMYSGFPINDEFDECLCGPCVNELTMSFIL